ncbi:MAG: ROK family transcriptional regulator [Litoreibacter sp.]
MKTDTSRVKRPHLRDIRTHNRSRILQILRESELISRQELAARLDLTPASLSRISRELIAQGVCREVPTSRENGQRGRPSVALQINAKGGYLVAISISSFSRLVSIVDISGKRHFHQEIPKEVTASGETTVAFIGDYVDRLISAQELARGKIIGAALTLPGSIDQQTGCLTKSILLNWPGFAIESRLSERLHCPVRVENNADALCRHFLDAQPTKEHNPSSVFLAHVSEGMGASIAIGGRIVRRLADEGWINDISVPTVGPSGEDWVKLSQMASGRAVLTNLPDSSARLRNEGVDFSEVLGTFVTKANQSLETESRAFFDAGHALGANLMPLTIAIAPETIVLAGPILKADAYFAGVQKGYADATAEMDIQPSRIVVSHASYIDATECLALHDFFLSGAYGT